MACMRIWLTMTVTAVVVVAAAPPATANGATTTRVSVSTTGDQSNDRSDDPAISADGRYVTFDSDATNLVPDDTNGVSDIFVRDRITGTTTRVSVSTTGDQANGFSRASAISADGRYVAYHSLATNLVPDDTNDEIDVFVRDRATGTTTRVSVSTNGYQANHYSELPAISADGRYITYHSLATNLVPRDTNSAYDVFVRDQIAGTTRRVSVSTAGDQGDRDSFEPAISADGRYVSYTSRASNLVPDDANGDLTDVLVWDRTTGSTRRISVSTGGDQGNDDSFTSALSADGRYVSYASDASNLAPGDTNNATDVFVWNRITGTTRRVSVSTTGNQGDGFSRSPAISADGRYVTYQSLATNLVPDDTNDVTDIFVRDRITGTTRRVSVSTTGDQANHHSELPAISADGRYITYHSLATNLVPDDTNDVTDIFVRHRGGH
ncbi:WD40-like Beta Propeller Repeat [Micromonospora echinospora]|uniref:WD40-like Beta Propeller Repeat n=2 Tax=Micromonospora echinospora TaxID=1877 RepID=A0A1C4YKL1_MICEC|nr:WD40-like Beta Propeller Repeat [Micromonospora echinospora]